MNVMTRLLTAGLVLTLACGPGLRSGGGRDGGGDAGVPTGRGDGGPDDGDDGGDDGGDVGTGTDGGDDGGDVGTGTDGGGDPSVLEEPSIGALALHFAALEGEELVLEVSGSGFRRSSVVTVQGQPLPTDFVSDAHLVAVLSLSAVVPEGLVRVVNPLTEGGSSDPSLLPGLPVPSISRLEPGVLEVRSTPLMVRVSGRDFRTGAVVQVEGAARTTRVLSTAELEVDLLAEDVASGRVLGLTVRNPPEPAGTSAPILLTVRNPTPQLLSLQDSVLPVRSIAVSPAGELHANAPVLLRFSGEGILPATEVQWRGQMLPLASCGADGRSGSVLLPPSVGPDEVVLVNPGPGGGASGPLVLTRRDGPLVGRLSPGSVSVSDAGTEVRVEGVGFEAEGGGTPVVLWEGTALPTIVEDAGGVLRAQVGPELLGGAREVTLQVRRADGALSPPAHLSVLDEAPAPVLHTVLPGQAPAGSGPLTVQVRGAGFHPSSHVTWRGLPVPTQHLGDALLEVRLGAEDLATDGLAWVQVTTPAPGGGTSLAAPFLVQADAPPPRVEALAPMSAPAGAPGLSLEVQGEGFLAHSEVRWNGAPLQTEPVGPGRLRAEVPAALLATEGRASVTVSTWGSVERTSPPVWFSVQAPAPVSLTSAQPPLIDEGLTTHVRLTGSGFGEGSVVLWGERERVPSSVTATELTVELAIKTEQRPVPLRVVTPGVGESAPLYLDLAPCCRPLRLAGLSRSVVSEWEVPVQSASSRVDLLGAEVVPVPTLHWEGRWACGPECLGVQATPTEQLFFQLQKADTAEAGVGLLFLQHGVDAAHASPPVPISVDALRPVPLARAVSPASVVAGWGGLWLRVDGQGFHPQSVVRWNGAALPTTSLQDALLAWVSAEQTAQPGAARITVSTPGPGGGDSLPLTLGVRAEPLAGAAVTGQ